jgi:hypothetical protein
LRPGDFVTVQITEPSLQNVAIVPATAVAADETVLVVNAENRLEQAQTEILRRQQDDVIIAVRGLDGAQIVAERSPLLGAGISVRPITPGTAQAEAPALPELIELDEARRGKLVAFVEASRMPADVKRRMIAQLEEPKVPATVIARLESRMGG